MRLWSIQDVQALDVLAQFGALQCAERFADRYFHRPYDWMAEQLSSRIGAPPAGMRWPVWAWIAKPDLRSTGYAPRGNPCARIEFIADRSQILLSDFDAWHAVLNDHPYFATDEEYERYEQLKCRADAAACARLQAAKVESWQRIFIDEATTSSHLVQAVLWQIRQDQVRRVELFQAR